MFHIENLTGFNGLVFYWSFMFIILPLFLSIPYMLVYFILYKSFQLNKSFRFIKLFVIFILWYFVNAFIGQLFNSVFSIDPFHRIFPPAKINEWDFPIFFDVFN